MMMTRGRWCSYRTGQTGWVPRFSTMQAWGVQCSLFFRYLMLLAKGGLFPTPSLLLSLPFFLRPHLLVLVPIPRGPITYHYGTIGSLTPSTALRKTRGRGSSNGAGSSDGWA